MVLARFQRGDEQDVLAGDRQAGRADRAGLGAAGAGGDRQHTARERDAALPRIGLDVARGEVRDGQQQIAAGQAGLEPRAEALDPGGGLPFRAPYRDQVVDQQRRPHAPLLQRREQTGRARHRPGRAQHEVEVARARPGSVLDAAAGRHGAQLARGRRPHGVEQLTDVAPDLALQHARPEQRMPQLRRQALDRLLDTRASLLVAGFGGADGLFGRGRRRQHGFHVRPAHLAQVGAQRRLLHPVADKAHPLRAGLGDQRAHDLDRHPLDAARVRVEAEIVEDILDIHPDRRGRLPFRRSHLRLLP